MRNRTNFKELCGKTEINNFKGLEKESYFYIDNINKKTYNIPLLKINYNYLIKNPTKYQLYILTLQVNN
jgi:hypothetical protein